MIRGGRSWPFQRDTLDRVTQIHVDVRIWFGAVVKAVEARPGSPAQLRHTLNRQSPISLHFPPAAVQHVGLDLQRSRRRAYRNPLLQNFPTTGFGAKLAGNRRFFVSTSGTDPQGSPDGSIEGKQVAWGSLRKIGFRLLFCYVVLFGMFCLNVEGLTTVYFRKRLINPSSQAYRPGCILAS